MRLPQLTKRMAAAASTAAASSTSAWELHSRAAARIAAGADVVMLTIGAPETPVASVATEALQRALASPQPALWNYAPALGVPALRNAIATATQVPAEQVAVVPGGQAGLFMSLKLLLGLDGGEVLLPAPCYSTYDETVKAAGGTPVAVASSAADGFSLHVSAVRAAITPATRGIMLATPNNPTGRVLSRELMVELGALCEAKSLWCISDETYMHLLFDGARHTSAAHVSQLAARCIVVGSFSKVLLRPGWRLGWLVAPPHLVAPLQALAQAAHFGLSPFLQEAACAVLNPPALAAVCAAEVGRYQARRDALLASLAAADEQRLVVGLRPEAGMFVLVDVRGVGVTSLEFAGHLLDEYDVATLPGEGFGVLGFLRVALLADEATMVEVGRRIAACAAALKRRSASPAPAADESPLAGGAALFAVRLDASNDGWSTAMLAGLRTAAGPAARVLEWRDGMSDAELADVDAVFAWDPPPGLLRRLPRLRMVASLGAGVDHCAAEYASVASNGVALVRCVDPLAARRLADYVLWAVLHLTRRMEDFGEAQARAQWDASPQSADPSDTRVGVLGLGAMGSAAAESLARNGFAVSTWSRTGAVDRPPPSGVPMERVLAGDDTLEAFLSAVDVLVCVLPLTDATRGLLSARRLRALPRGAAFVNVGRAECVVQDDLLAALDDGHISRAVLDVAPEEPLPADAPLWKHPRVRLTPHVAGHSSAAAGAAQVVENWRRMRTGQPLLHLVPLR